MNTHTTILQLSGLFLGQSGWAGTFRHLLDFLLQNEDNTVDTPTIQMDCHPIQTNWCPHLCHPAIFTLDAFPGTTLPIYPGLRQAPNMLACIPDGLNQLGLIIFLAKTYVHHLSHKFRRSYCCILFQCL